MQPPLQEFNIPCLFTKLIDIKRHRLLVFQPSDSVLHKGRGIAAVLTDHDASNGFQSSAGRPSVPSFISEYYYHSMMSPLSGITLSSLLTGSCWGIHKIKLNLKIRKVINLTKPAPCLTK